MHGKSASNGGTGMMGEATATTGVTKGMHGKSDSDQGAGVFGEATDSSGVNMGVHGKTNSPSGFAGYFEGRAYVEDSLGVGTETPTARLHIGGTAGVDGIRFPDGTLQTTAPPAGASSWQVNGSDLYYNDGNVGVGTSTPGARVTGATSEESGTAVYGSATGSGITIGVRGRATHGSGTGVQGEVTNSSGTACGVRGRSSTSGGTGVEGEDLAASNGAGVRGNSSSSGGKGVYGSATGSGATAGVRGSCTSLLAASAGVLAVGNGVASPGSLQAAALDIRNGALVVSGDNRPAGAIEFDASAKSWEAIEDCRTDGHSHTIGWKTAIQFPHSLLTPESFVLLSVEDDGSSGAGSYSAVLTVPRTSGHARINVSRLGVEDAGGCPTPTGTIRVHYLIINPATP
jgi:hypothetical protein